MSESAYCKHGIVGPCQECYEAEFDRLRSQATDIAANCIVWKDRAEKLEAALRLLREECQDEGRCSQVGHRVSLPCVKLVDEALGIAPPFGGTNE